MASATQKARKSRSNGEGGSRRFKRDADTEQDERMEEQEPAGNGGDDESQESSGGGDSPTLTSELRDTIRDAALEVLRPVAKKATTSAAKYAATKGPDLVKDKVMPALEGAGGIGGLATSAMSKTGGVTGAVGGIAEKLTGGGGKGGKKPTGHGRGRRLPVQVFVDVAVDIQTAYDQFTQFEDFPNFMHRVEKIEQKDDTTLMWHENIWGVRRSWEAEIVEQKPCERIVWRAKGQTQSVGVVTFHKLSDTLTRVYVNMDFQPKGLFEKTASGMRMSRRALKSDLMRFKAFVEMKDDTTGAWRGVVEDSEVVDYEDDESEGREDEEAEGREDEEPEGREDAEPEGREDEDFEDEEEEDEEEPEAREDEEYEDEEEEDEEEEEEPERGSAEAREDEDEEEDEPEEEEPPKPRRRRAASTRSSSSSTGRGRSTKGSTKASSAKSKTSSAKSKASSSKSKASSSSGRSRR